MRSRRRHTTRSRDFVEEFVDSERSASRQAADVEHVDRRSGWPVFARGRGSVRIMRRRRLPIVAHYRVHLHRTQSNALAMTQNLDKPAN